MTTFTEPMVRICLGLILLSSFIFTLIRYFVCTHFRIIMFFYLKIEIKNKIFSTTTSGTSSGLPILFRKCVLKHELA